MKTAILILALLSAALPTQATIPAGETWRVPDVPVWHQFQHDIRLEYTILIQVLASFRRESDPLFYDRVSASASSLGWVYQFIYGVPITPLPTIPAALAPL